MKILSKTDIVEHNYSEMLADDAGMEKSACIVGLTEMFSDLFFHVMIIFE